MIYDLGFMISQACRMDLRALACARSDSEQSRRNHSWTLMITIRDADHGSHVFCAIPGVARNRSERPWSRRFV